MLIFARNAIDLGQDDVGGRGPRDQCRRGVASGVQWCGQRRVSTKPGELQALLSMVRVVPCELDDSAKAVEIGDTLKTIAEQWSAMKLEALQRNIELASAE